MPWKSPADSSDLRHNQADTQASGRLQLSTTGLLKDDKKMGCPAHTRGLSAPPPPFKPGNNFQDS